MGAPWLGGSPSSGVAGLVLCSLLVTKDWNPLTSCFARRDGDVGLADDESDVYMREWTGEWARLSGANDTALAGAEWAEGEARTAVSIRWC